MTVLWASVRSPDERSEIRERSVSLNGNPGFCCAQSRLLARGRVEGAVILDGKVPHAVLLELLIELSAGTLIHR
jgi:hypothetical protein